MALALLGFDFRIKAHGPRQDHVPRDPAGQSGYQEDDDRDDALLVRLLGRGIGRRRAEPDAEVDQRGLARKR